MQTLKCVTVGDGTVGKTCMLMCHFFNVTPKDYIPTVYDTYSHDIIHEDKHIKMELWDTAGQEQYDRLRALAYTNTDVFLLCFAISNRNSFINVEHKWKPELKHFCPHGQIILVGTKYDLRDDPETIQELKVLGQKPITYTEGVQMAKKIQAYKYVECSSFQKIGLKEVFTAALESVLQRTEKKKRRMCSIL